MDAALLKRRVEDDHFGYFEKRIGSHMKKVITYGTYDLLHHGHIRLLERAKALGDYLVVGVTGDSFDRGRGKINVVQSLAERIEGVRATGLADEIIVEEYEGQKIDDIQRLGIDIFTVGSDWRGKFDYLSEYCHVVYLERTEGVSSSEIRSERAALRIGFVGSGSVVDKYVHECAHVNGLSPVGRFLGDVEKSGAYSGASGKESPSVSFDSYDELLDASDVVFVASRPEEHSLHIRQALLAGRHVLCESPVTLSAQECRDLFVLADKRGLVLREAIKTAYATAYHRLLLLVKGGRIGRVVSVEATCTSLSDLRGSSGNVSGKWASSSAWGPTALLPLLQILGTDYNCALLARGDLSTSPGFDVYGRVDLRYSGATGTAMFGKAVKSEGSLVVSGTEGYIYVPAPWWKTDYFEIRREDPSENERFYYQLDGEGIRYELMTFARAALSGRDIHPYVEREVSIAIAGLLERFQQGTEALELDPIAL